MLVNEYAVVLMISTVSDHRHSSCRERDVMIIRSLSCWSSDRCWSSGRCHVWRDGVVDAMHQPASDAMSLTVFSECDWPLQIVIDGYADHSMHDHRHCHSDVRTSLHCDRHCHCQRHCIVIRYGIGIACHWHCDCDHHCIDVGIAYDHNIVIAYDRALGLHMIVHSGIWSCIVIVHCHCTVMSLWSSLHCHSSYRWHWIAISIVIINTLMLGLHIRLALPSCIVIAIALPSSLWSSLHCHAFAIVIVNVIALSFALPLALSFALRLALHCHCAIVIIIVLTLACDRRLPWSLWTSFHRELHRHCIIIRIELYHHCIAHWNLIIVFTHIGIACDRQLHCHRIAIVIVH